MAVATILLAAGLMGCATTTASIGHAASQVSSADTRFAAYGLVRQSDLPTGWSLVSAETDDASQPSTPGCQLWLASSHITGSAQDDLALNLSPLGGSSADLTEIVDATSSSSDARRLQHAFTTPQYQACWEAETTPDYWPDLPRPTVAASATAAGLPLSMGPQIIGVRYHFWYPPQFEEPETYVDVIEVVEGRFRASARLSGGSVAALTAMDTQVARMVSSRLHASLATSPPVLAAALPEHDVRNYVGNFRPPDASQFFQETPTQGAITGNPIVWKATDDGGSSLTPQPGGVTLALTVPNNDVVWTIPVSKDYSNVQLDADVTQTAGVTDGWIGLACMVGQDYVAFVIDNSGDWQIDRYIQAGEHRLVLLKGSDPSIHPLTATNHMTISCTDDTDSNNQFALGVNGKLLAVFNAQWSNQAWLPGIYAFNGSAPTQTSFTNILQSGT